MRVFKRGSSWFYDVNFEGKRLRKIIPGARARGEAQNALITIKADILRGEFRIKTEKKIFFEDLVKKYIKYAKNNKDSWERDVFSLKNLTPHFKGMLLSKINPEHIENFKNKRIKEVSPATCNRELSCLRFMFSLAVRYKDVDVNPVKEVKQFKEKQKDMIILDKQQIMKLTETASGHLRVFIILALNTGARKGELLKLRWSDVDFTNLYIFIKETKSGVPRKVPMNSVVVETLKGIKRESEFVFYNPTTKKQINSVYKGFKAASQRIGVPGLRIHDLRHLAATLMVTGGTDLVTVSKILGHSSIQMTMRYSHPTPENMQRAVDKLGEIFITHPDEDQTTKPEKVTTTSFLIH